MRKKPSNINEEKLGKSRETFQLQLENQFQLLHDEQQEIDANLDEWYEQMVDAIHKTASKIAGKKKKTHSNIIVDSTRNLMEKTDEIDSTGIQNMEYSETCKTIMKKLMEDLRNFNSKMMKTTIERSLEKTKKKLAQE